MQWQPGDPPSATTLAFGVASIASASADSVEALTMWRFVTGIGLGGAMPTAIPLTSEFCPSRIRSLLVTGMFCDFAIGSAVGGFVASASVASHGWKGVLVLGGVLPIMLATALAKLLPELVRYLALRGGRTSGSPPSSTASTHFVAGLVFPYRAIQNRELRAFVRFRP